MSGVYAILSLGLHTQMDYVGHGIPSSPLDNTYNQKTLGVVLPLLPLDSIHGRTMSGVARQHRPFTTHTFGQRRAWKVNIVLGHHIWSDDVGRGNAITALGLCNTLLMELECDLLH